MFVTGSSNLFTDFAQVQINYVRPVINLNADVNFIGEGTIDNPYEIITE